MDLRYASRKLLYCQLKQVQCFITGGWLPTVLTYYDLPYYNSYGFTWEKLFLSLSLLLFHSSLDSRRVFLVSNLIIPENKTPINTNTHSHTCFNAKTFSTRVNVNSKSERSRRNSFIKDSRGERQLFRCTLIYSMDFNPQNSLLYFVIHM